MYLTLLIVIAPSVIAVDVETNFNISFVNNTLNLNFERDSFSYPAVSFINETKKIHLKRSLDFKNETLDFFSNITNYCSQNKTVCEQPVACENLEPSENITALTQQVQSCRTNLQNYITQDQEREEPVNPIFYILGTLLVAHFGYYNKRIIGRSKEEKEVRSTERDYM